MPDLDDWAPAAASTDQGADDWVQGAQPGFLTAQARNVGNILTGANQGFREGMSLVGQDLTTPIDTETYIPHNTGLRGALEEPFAPSIGTAVGTALRGAKTVMDLGAAVTVDPLAGAMKPVTVPVLQKVYEAGGMSPEDAKLNAEAATENIANIPFVADMARVHTAPIEAGKFAPEKPVSAYTSPVPANPVPTGAVADSFVANSPIGSVLDAFGEGPRTNWGIKDIMAGVDTSALPNAIPNSLTQTYAEAVKSFNESFQRSAASTALVQAGPDIAEQLAYARNLGVIGEGEAGWKGTIAPDEGQLAGRAEAAKLIPPEPEPVPAFDIHEAARNIAPEVFEGPNGYDALQARQDTFRRWIDELSDARDEQFKTNPPLGDQISDVQSKIDGILGKVNGVEDRLTKTKAAQLDDLRDQHEDLTEQSQQIARQDTPDMQRVRQSLLENDYLMRDKAEAVSAAYRTAREGAPAEEPAPVAEEAAQATPEPAQAAEPESLATAPVSAEIAPETTPAQPEPALAPKSTTPSRPVPENVAADVSQKLVAAGRPVEEANAAGALIQAHYDARAARFGGALGTGPELYAREAPEVRGSRVRAAAGERAREYAQAKEQTDGPAFKKWFGNSKVIDEAGHPQVAYHGTASDFDTFDLDKSGSGAGSEAERAIFFSTDPSVASHYAEVMGAGHGETPGATHAGAVYPAYLKIENPYISKIKYYNSKDIAAEIAKAKALGHDGVSFPDMTYDGERGQIAAFSPEQVKSAIGNRGTFDPNDPRILNQSARGKIAFRDAQATITLMKDANASTFIHETGHQWLEELVRDSKDERAPADLTKDAKTVREYLGAKDGEDITSRQHEKFARSFERYMMEGTAPSKGLADAFAKFKNWLTQIYETVTKLRAPINDDIRHVFDRLLTKPGEEAVIAPERTPSKTFADLHEADALHTAPEHADPVADTVAGEVDQIAEQKVPDVVPDLTNGGETSGVPTEAGSDAGGSPAAEPGPVQTGNAEGPGKVSGGGSDVTAESPSARAKSGPGIRSEQPAGPNARFTEPDSGLIDKAGNIRLDNLETPEDIKSVIRDTANANDDFFAARRGVISAGQQMELADALGMDAAQINFRKVGQAFNAEEILAARKLLVQSATDVRDAMIKAADGSDADVIAYGEAAARHRMIQEQVSGITAEAGRALGAFRRIAGSDLTKAVGKVLGEDADKTLFQLREEARLGRTLETPQQVSKFINDVEATRGEKIKAGILEYYINALISGPITHMRYSVGNAVNALWTPLVEIPTAAGIGRIREALGGEGERVHLGEAGAQLYAIGKGSRDGLKAAIEAFRTGSSPPLPGEKLSGDFMGPRPHAIPGRIGDVLNIPSHSVAAIHSFFKSLRYEQNIQGLAYRAAMNEGKIGEAFNARIVELTKSPTEDMMHIATQDALKELYMAPTEYSSFMGNLNRAINSNLLAKIIVPFMKIGSQITRNAFIERTPIGLFSREVRANLFGDDPVARQLQAAKMAGGIALIGTTVMMAAEGLATGDGPTDPKERATWLLTHQPNHITIGNVSIPYQGLGSLGMLMRFSANSYETAHAWDGENYEKLVPAALEGISKSVLDDNFMRGVKDMLDAVYHYDEYGQSYLRGFVTNWLPFSVGMGQVAREIDPYHRQAKTLFDEAKSKTPFASESLQPRYDMFGQPMPNGGPPADYQNDPVIKAMADLHTGIGRLENKIRGVPLTDQQYADFSRIAGRLTHITLKNVVGTPGFSNMPAAVRLKIIDSAIGGAREQARNQIMMQSAHTDNDIIAKATEAKRAGMH